jgi:hypothetical protein
MKKEEIFTRLWKNYIDQNPAAKKIYNLFLEQGETIQNDHIAFRTFNDERVSIDVIAKPFLDVGYEPKDTYNFDQKHLFARHYEHKTDQTAPKIFISELILEAFSEYLQSLIREKIDEIPEDLLSSSKLIYAGRPWEEPSYTIYEKLRKESEYAAWMYAYGYQANHFTIFINQLQHYNSVEEVNKFLKSHGFIMNTSGGEVKGSPEKGLEQSSIKANRIEVAFTEGTKIIPACYYEFAKRYVMKDGQLYQGFIAQSADKIFESTDFYQE